MLRNGGFTLFELMMTLLLGALLLGVAVPVFDGLIARHQQRVEIDALFHAIHVARKESIMRRKVVSLCPSLDGRQCNDSKDWSYGWLMFENADRDSPPYLDADEALLQVYTAASNVQILANRKGFTLRATERRATNGTLVFCDAAHRIAPKALVISYTGRPRVATHKTNREAYTCAD